jgi:hypothetical protein
VTKGPDPCATVTVVDVRTGAGTTSPVNAAPGTPCPTRDGYVGTLWWDGDGVLNAYFQAAGQDDVTNASQRRLEGDRWVAAGTERTTQAHRLGGGATAVLSHPGVRDRDFLLLVADGRRTKIDGEVSRVAAAPPAP